MKLRFQTPTRIFVRFVSFFVKIAPILIGIFLISAISYASYRGYSFLRSRSLKPNDLLSFFGTPSQNLDSTAGETNFLLLGIRGEGDTDSPNLSDTIIIANINYENKRVNLLSIPRDLWVPSLRAKINTAYHYGELATPSGGIRMANTAILENTGLPIHYTAVINFTLFRDVIDLLGGVDIDVTEPFTDTLFPIPGRENALPISSRYETITFPAGINHLDGATALKYVRSRHATGDEGTDFARSRRQQQVITAISNRILTPQFLLNEGSVNSLMKVIDKNLITDINPSLYPTLAKLALDLKDQSINHVTLSETPDENGVSILYNPPSKNYLGEWVLIPKNNDWKSFKQYLHNRLSGLQ